MKERDIENRLKRFVSPSAPESLDRRMERLFENADAAGRRRVTGLRRVVVLSAATAGLACIVLVGSWFGGRFGETNIKEPGGGPTAHVIEITPTEAFQRALCGSGSGNVRIEHSQEESSSNDLTIFVRGGTARAVYPADAPPWEPAGTTAPPAGPKTPSLKG